MAFKTLIWAMTQQDLESTTQLVLIKLASFRNQKTGQCNPSQKTLARACNKAVSTINAHLRLLEDQGLIRRIPQFDKSSGATRPSQIEFPLAHTSHKRGSTGNSAKSLRLPGEGPSDLQHPVPLTSRRQIRKGTGK